MAGTAGRFVLPYQTVIDAAGIPLPGALLNFYVSGTDNRQNTYTNATLTTPNANPVVADAGGRFGNIFLLPAPYKVVLTDSLGNEIWTADPVFDSSGATVEINLRRVTVDTTVLSTDGVLEVDASAGAIVVTYPLDLGSAALVQPVTIVKVDNTANPVSIKSDADATILAALNTPAAGANMEWAIVYSNSAGLRILT